MALQGARVRRSQRGAPEQSLNGWAAILLLVRLSRSHHFTALARQTVVNESNTIPSPAVAASPPGW